MSSNGFPKYIAHKMINNTSLNNGNIRITDPVYPTGCVEMCRCVEIFLGVKKGQNLTKSCIKKLKRYNKKGDMNIVGRVKS